MDDKADYPIEEPEGRVVEPEILGHPKPAPLWKRVLGRAAGGLILGGLGLLLMIIGGFLTISLIGAPIGIPLLILGLLMLLCALLAVFGGGRFQVVSFRRPPRT